MCFLHRVISQHNTAAALLQLHFPLQALSNQDDKGVAGLCEFGVWPMIWNDKGCIFHLLISTFLLSWPKMPKMQREKKGSNVFNMFPKGNHLNQFTAENYICGILTSGFE